jgi:enoyl-CoA hydratase/carnithine racemase
MHFETIRYEVEDRIATITFNRPDKLNAVSPQMVSELKAAYAAVESDDAVWIAIVTGAGRAFCAGADVAEIPGDGRVLYDEPYLSTLAQWEAPQEATPPFRSMTKPVLAAVNGLCCGAGLDLVTTGDIAIASERAEFFDPHVSIGLVSGREMVRLARVLPTNIAMRVALTGRHERIGAQRAYELGMVSEVVAHDRLLARARRSRRWSTATRRSPCAGRVSRSARVSTCRCTRPRSSPRRSASACCAPRTRTRGRAHSSRSASRSGSADDHRVLRDPLRDDSGSRRDDHARPPDALNAFDRTMCEEIRSAWQRIKADPAVNAVVLRAPATARSAPGLDVKKAVRPARRRLEPRGSRRAALAEVAEGVEAGRVRGAGDVHRGRVLLPERGDIVICSQDATFFDSHVTLRNGVGARARRPDAPDRTRRDAAHRALGQRRARLRRDRAADRARERGRRARSAVAARARDRGEHREQAVRRDAGTVRAIWESLDRPYRAAMEQGLLYTRLGNPIGMAEVKQKAPAHRPPRIR